jgi:arginyl-tRNA synthetase
MKETVTRLLTEAVATLAGQGLLEIGAGEDVSAERTRDSAHGDFASNVAMKLAKGARCNPRELAAKIIQAMPECELLEKTEIAGPGFINFTFRKEAYYDLIDSIRSADGEYGKSGYGQGQKVMVEFVSTNPTGPLHVGHGRGAAYGDALVRVLTAAGFKTHSEYYINDAGRQMDILALSVWLRYLELCNSSVDFPANAYQGGYIKDVAAGLFEKFSNRFNVVDSTMFTGLADDAEQAMDELISRSRKLLGEENFRIVFDAACDSQVDDIRQDLEEFGVMFDEWFSERSLVENGDITRSIRKLEENGHMYEKEGALWFRSTDFGDEKDRVVIRANGAHTYFASDIAYHYNKAERGFDRILNIFGSDHHGYTRRVSASFEALGNDPERLQYLLVQFAILYRGQQKLSMSTRGGNFVTLRELREEVGNDAARFFYVLRKPDQHMEFDLELAKSQSSENPVYYIQYAHARVCSVFRQLEEKGMKTLRDTVPDYKLLVEPQEEDLLKLLSRFPEVVELSAITYEPHQLAYYLRDLANAFHTYYNAHPFLSSAQELRIARLGLIDSTRIVIRNGLAMLGVSAPVSM